MADTIYHCPLCSHTTTAVSLMQEHIQQAHDMRYEYYDGKFQKVINGDRAGWWRYNEHYDREGYCDNPGRGY